jgi:hypothetical protein
VVIAEIAATVEAETAAKVEAETAAPTTALKVAHPHPPPNSISLQST